MQPNLPHISSIVTPTSTSSPVPPPTGQFTFQVPQCPPTPSFDQLLTQSFTKMKEQHNKEMEENMRQKARDRQTKADEAAKKLMADYVKKAEQFLTEDEENAKQTLEETITKLRQENEERLKELESKKGAIKLVVAAKTQEVENLKEQLKTTLDDELKELRRKREALETEENELQKKLAAKLKAEEELKQKEAKEKANAELKEPNDEVSGKNDGENYKEDSTIKGNDGNESVTAEKSNDDPLACLRTEKVTKALAWLGATLPPRTEDIKSENIQKRPSSNSPSPGSKRQRFETKEDVAFFLIGEKKKKGTNSPARASGSSPRSPRAKKVLEFDGYKMTDVEELKELKTHKEDAIMKADKMLKLKRTKKNVDPLYETLKEMKLVISSEIAVEDIPDYSFFTLLLPYCPKEISELPEVEAAEAFRKKVCDFICANCEYTKVSNCNVLRDAIVIVYVTAENERSFLLLN